MMVGSVGGSRMDLIDEDDSRRQGIDKAGSSFKSDHNFMTSQEQEEVKYSAFASNS